jgi:ribosome biogenesis GTPase A
MNENIKLNNTNWWNNYENFTIEEKILLIQDYEIGEFYKHVSISTNINDIDKINIGVFGRPQQGKSSFIKTLLSILLNTPYSDISVGKF